MERDAREGRVQVRIVRTEVPGWLALFLVLPAALLFVVSLAIVFAVGLIGALFLPLAWRRIEKKRSSDTNCIELSPDDFHTVERHDRLEAP